MEVRISLLVGLTVLAGLLVGPLGVKTVNAVPGLNLGDPANTWTPYGPHSTINHVLLKYYDTDTSEFLDFQNGGLDIADTGTAGTGPPASTWPNYDANPDWNMSGSQGGGSWQGIYFNGASSTWLHWGCDWQYYNSACGIEMRQAFIHLIDRQAFDARHLFGGGGIPIWDDIPANKALANGSPMQSPASNFCTWDTISNAGCNASTGPYSLASNPNGFAPPGSPDFCLAADHMIRAGIAIGKTPGTCVLTGVNSRVFSYPIRAKVRCTEPRLSMGTGFSNAINQLFGGTASVIQYGNCNIIRLIVFSEIVTPIDDWDYYTYGYQDSNLFPTYLYPTYSSQFAFKFSAGDQGLPYGGCSGAQSVADEPTNPTFTCIPSLDNALAAAIHTGSETTFENLIITGTNSAANIMGRSVVTIPVHTFTLRTPALRTVDGLTNARGVGYATIQEELSAHKSPYVPLDSRFQFNGGGSLDTLRWGQAQGIQFVNPFQVGSFWEFNTLSSVYDTLFSGNPESPNQVYCNMCQTLTPSVVGGNQEYTVTLRQNLRWQDGPTVDAYDVKFSLLNERDFTGSILASFVSSLVDVQVLSPNTLTIIMQGQSVSYSSFLSGFPIIPRHLWEMPGDRTYGDVGRVDPAKVDPSYDPITFGTFIGSGPFACVSIFPEDLGRIGTGCAKNPDGTRAGQSITGGGTMLLTRYDFTTKSRASDPFAQWFRNNNPSWGTGPNPVAAESGGYQEFLWADRFDNGAVTIADVNDVANCYGHTSNGGSCNDYAYWNRAALHPGTPNTITSELAIVASHYGDEWVNPYAWGPNPPLDATSGSMFNIIPLPLSCTSPNTPAGCYP